MIGHRKHWVVLTQLVAFFASLLLLFVRQPEQQITLLASVFFVHSLFASVQDASVDAIAIFVVPEKERGRVNAFMRGGFLLGIAFGAAVLTTILHRNGFFAAALLQSVLLLLFSILTFFIKLDRNDPLLPQRSKNALRQNKQAATDETNPSLKWLFRELYLNILSPVSLKLFGGIALAYLCFSIFIRSYSYHIIHVLHWHDSDVSVLQGSWGSLLTFGVIIGGGVISDRLGAARLQRIVLWSVGIFVLLLCSSFAFWHLRPVTIAGLIGWNFADPMLSVAAFPILMSLCRPHIEGSQFTTYMAAINFCDVIGSYLTGWTLLYLPAPWIEAGCGITVLLLAATLSVQQWQRRNKEAGNPLPAETA